MVYAVAGHGLNAGLTNVVSKYAGADLQSRFRILLNQGFFIALGLAAFFFAINFVLTPFILKSVADPAAYPAEMGFLRIRIFGLPFLYLFQLINAFFVASLRSRLLIYGVIAETIVNIFLD